MPWSRWNMPWSSQRCHGAVARCHGAVKTCHGAVETCHGTVETCHAAVTWCHGAGETCHAAVERCHAAVETCHGAVMWCHGAGEQRQRFSLLQKWRNCWNPFHVKGRMVFFFQLQKWFVHCTMLLCSNCFDKLFFRSLPKECNAFNVCRALEQIHVRICTHEFFKKWNLSKLSCINSYSASTNINSRRCCKTMIHLQENPNITLFDISIIWQVALITMHPSWKSFNSELLNSKLNKAADNIWSNCEELLNFFIFYAFAFKRHTCEETQSKHHHLASNDFWDFSIGFRNDSAEAEQRTCALTTNERVGESFEFSLPEIRKQNSQFFFQTNCWPSFSQMFIRNSIASQSSDWWKNLSSEENDKKMLNVDHSSEKKGLDKTNAADKLVTRERMTAPTFEKKVKVFDNLLTKGINKNAWQNICRKSFVPVTFVEGTNAITW